MAGESVADTGDTDTTGAAITLFRETYGTAPTGTWSAPGGVGLVGEQVDRAGGVSVSMTTPMRAAVAAAPRTDGSVRVSADGLITTHEIGAHGVAPSPGMRTRERIVGLIGRMYQSGLLSRGEGGADVALVNDVPVRRGLAAIPAAQAAFALALAELSGHEDTIPLRSQLAELCTAVDAEVLDARDERVGAATALRAVADSAMVLDHADGSLRPVPYTPAEARVEFLVLVPGSAETPPGGDASRIDLLTEAAAFYAVDSLRSLPDAEARARAWARALATVRDDAPSPDTAARRTRHLLTEIERARAIDRLLRSRDVTPIGAVFDEIHESLRTEFESSTPLLDRIVTAARDAGALGAHASGDRRGSVVVAATAIGTAERVAASVAAAVPDVTSFVAMPAPGAARGPVSA